MGDPTSFHIEAQVVRVQRVLEEALDRYVGQSEGERSEALVHTLRTELSALPAAARGQLLDALGALYPEPLAPAGPGADGEARRRLERENERLREALAAAEAKPGVPQAVAAASGDPIAESLLQMLAGPARRGGAARVPGSEERALAVLQGLVDFVASVARGFLSVGLDPDKTMAGHFHGVIADELDGKRPAGSVKKLLDQMRLQIGHQVLAFRDACDAGARELLRQLDPEAIAAEAGGARGMFGAKYEKYWTALQGRYEELLRADDLFQVYFGVAFQRKMHDLMKQAERAGHGG